MSNEKQTELTSIIQTTEQLKDNMMGNLKHHPLLRGELENIKDSETLATFVTKKINVALQKAIQSSNLQTEELLKNLQVITNYYHHDKKAFKAIQQKLQIIFVPVIIFIDKNGFSLPEHAAIERGYNSLQTSVINKPKNANMILCCVVEKSSINSQENGRIILTQKTPLASNLVALHNLDPNCFKILKPINTETTNPIYKLFAKNHHYRKEIADYITKRKVKAILESAKKLRQKPKLLLFFKDKFSNSSSNINSKSQRISDYNSLIQSIPEESDWSTFINNMKNIISKENFKSTNLLLASHQSLCHIYNYFDATLEKQNQSLHMACTENLVLLELQLRQQTINFTPFNLQSYLMFKADMLTNLMKKEAHISNSSEEVNHWQQFSQALANNKPQYNSLLLTTHEGLENIDCVDFTIQFNLYKHCALELGRTIKLMKEKTFESFLKNFREKTIPAQKQIKTTTLTKSQEDL